MQSVSATVATMGAKLSQLASQAGTQINSALVAIKGHGLNAINWAKQHPGIAGGGIGATVVVLSAAGYGMHRSRKKSSEEQARSAAAKPKNFDPNSQNKVDQYRTGLENGGLASVRKILAAAQLVPAVTPETAKECNENQQIMALQDKKDLFNFKIDDKKFGAFAKNVKAMQKAHGELSDAGDGCTPAELKDFKEKRDLVASQLAFADALMDGTVTMDEAAALDALLKTKVQTKENGAIGMFPSLNGDASSITRDGSGKVDFDRVNPEDFDKKVEAAVGKFRPLLGEVACDLVVEAAKDYGNAVAHWVAPVNAKVDPEPLKKGVLEADSKFAKRKEEAVAAAEAATLQKAKTLKNGRKPTKAVVDGLTKAMKDLAGLLKEKRQLADELNTGYLAAVAAESSRTVTGDGS